MTPEKLAAVKKRLSEMPSTPWRIYHGHDGVQMGIISTGGGMVVKVGGIASPASVGQKTAEFIAHAPTDLVALIAEVEHLTAERDEALALLAGAREQIEQANATLKRERVERGRQAHRLAILEARILGARDVIGDPFGLVDAMPEAGR